MYIYVLQVAVVMVVVTAVLLSDSDLKFIFQYLDGYFKSDLLSLLAM